MTTFYKAVILFDRGPQEIDSPEVRTIAEAVSNLTSANDFVVAVENGRERPLTEEEERMTRSAGKL